MESQSTIVKDEPFLSFSQFIFGSEDVSIRLVAESIALKNKLAGMNGNGEKLQVIKLSPLQGPLEDRIRSARQFNTRGYAVYYLPNQFSPRSADESYSSVVSFRAVVLDLDGAPLEPVLNWTIPPTVVINTSEGKYQCVWKLAPHVRCITLVNPDGITVDAYGKLCSQLAELFDGDQSVCKATQPFRAPGFTHWKTLNDKGEGYESRVYNRDSQDCPSGSASGEGAGSIWVWRQGYRQRYDQGACDAGGAVSGVCWDDLKRAITGARRNSKRMERGSGEGEARASHQISSEVAREEDSWQAPRVNLTELREGKVKVGAGDRHLTLLREARRLMGELDGDTDKVRELCLADLGQFTDGAQFIDGNRRNEFEKILLYARKYWAEQKAADDAEIKRILASQALSEDLAASVQDGSSESSSESANLLSAPADFQYDFSVGVLPVGRYNESAIVERVIQRFGDDLANLNGSYFCFNRNEKLWVPQSSNGHAETKARVTTCIKEAVREPGFVVDVSGGGKPSLSKTRSGISALLKAGAVRGMTAGVLNHIAVQKCSYWDFDADPKLLYCANGVVNLETGELREARNEDKLLNRSSVVWDSRAECPRWLRFISEVFAENDKPAEMVRFIQEVFAYSLSGLMSEQKIFCYLGDGSNGKSITLDALKKISGGYATIAAADELTLSSDKFSKAFERIGAHIIGRRVVVVDDFKMSGSWNEGFIKVLTGKEILSRKLYAEATTQPNHAKFHIGMNKAPKPEEENKGLLRRLCFIPFGRSFVASSKKGQELDRMVEEEASGVLLWASRAYAKVAEQGLTYPAETLAALEEYRQENFKYETSLEALYEFPQKESQSGSWENVENLVEEVNNYFQNQGEAFERVNVKSLGHMLKRAGALKSRRWDSETKNSARYVFLRKKSS